MKQLQMVFQNVTRSLPTSNIIGLGNCITPFPCSNRARVGDRGITPTVMKGFVQFADNKFERMAKLAAAPPSPILPIMKVLFPSHGGVSSGKSMSKMTFTANFAIEIDISSWLHCRHRRRHKMHVHGLKARSEQPIPIRLEPTPAPDRAVQSPRVRDRTRPRQTKCCIRMNPGQ